MPRRFDSAGSFADRARQARHQEAPRTQSRDRRGDHDRGQAGERRRPSASVGKGQGGASVGAEGAPAACGVKWTRLAIAPVRLGKRTRGSLAQVAAWATMEQPALGFAGFCFPGSFAVEVIAPRPLRARFPPRVAGLSRDQVRCPLDEGSRAAPHAEGASRSSTRSYRAGLTRGAATRRGRSRGVLRGFWWRSWRRST